MQIFSFFLFVYLSNFFCSLGHQVMSVLKYSNRDSQCTVCCLVRSQLPSFVKLCVNDDFKLRFLTRFRERYCTHAAWCYGSFSCQFSFLRIGTVDWSMNYQLVLQSLFWLTETGWIRSYCRANVMRNITCPQTLPEHRTLTWHINERVFTSAFLWFFRSLPSVSCKVSRRVFCLSVVGVLFLEIFHFITKS